MIPLLPTWTDSTVYTIGSIQLTPPPLYPYPVLNEIHNLPVINDYGPFWEKRYQSIGRFDLDGESETAYLDPKLLNEVGVRYLVTSRQAVAAQLRHISQSTDAPATPLPMPDLNCAALNCADAPIRIVDGFLRGVFIDGAGEHRLEMRFHPWAPLYGAIATLAGIGLLIGCCFIRRPIGSL